MGLQIAVDDPALVREARGAQDLRDDVDRRGRVERPLLAHDRLQRAPGDVLHRDVVGPVPLAAVEDRDDVRVRERGGARGLAAEALDELLVFGEVMVQHLHRELAAEQLVLGEVHVGHAPRAESRDHPVAPVDDRLRLNHGAALPSLPWRPAPRTRRPGPGRVRASRRSPRAGCEAGANAMNQTLLIAVPICVSAVPVLPATCTPGNLRLRAGAFVDDRFHHRRHGGRGRRFHHDRLHARRDLLARCALRGRRSVRSGAAPSACRGWPRPRRPPPSAAATTASLSWPIPMRPTSTRGLVGESRIRSPRYSPLADISSAG